MAMINEAYSSYRLQKKKGIAHTVLIVPTAVYIKLKSW